MSRYTLFDRDRLALRELSHRGHDLHARDVLPLKPPAEPFPHAEFPALCASILAARAADRPVVLMMGAHPIKLGLSRFIIDMVERGVVTHVATNGAGLIHDFELALASGTSENVPKWIQQGQFGLWRETGQMNTIIKQAALHGEGLGEALGRTIVQEHFPHAGLSVAAAGWRHGVPVTAHVSIGSDIIHSHASCDGAALGSASFTDFLIFAHAIENLEGGVFLNVGSAVTGPEVYLKALSMARNVARQQGKSIRQFTTAVFDLAELPADWREGTPSKDHPQYYYRPWKTILVRTVADGGQSYYFRGDHQTTLPTLWSQTAGRHAEATAPWSEASPPAALHR